MPCDIKAECLNDGVHWTCTCQNGFYGSGLSCVGMNNYLWLTSNIWMATHTNCLSPFIIIDYDECLSGNHNCSKNAECTNTPGDFDCSCHDSYFGDGFTCLGRYNNSGTA